MIWICYCHSSVVVDVVASFSFDNCSCVVFAVETLIYCEVFVI